MYILSRYLKENIYFRNYFTFLSYSDNLSICLICLILLFLFFLSVNWQKRLHGMNYQKYYNERVRSNGMRKSSFRRSGKGRENPELVKS